MSSSLRVPQRMNTFMEALQSEKEIKEVDLSIRFLIMKILPCQKFLPIAHSHVNDLFQFDIYYY